MKTRFNKKTLACLCASVFAANVYAEPSVKTNTEKTFDNTIFFGDSLTDTGTAAKGRDLPKLPVHTDFQGPIWAENFAAGLGHTALVYDTPKGGGTNYAVAGAETVKDIDGAPSVKTQITNYLTKTRGKSDPNALYVVWSGANDLKNAVLTRDEEIIKTQLPVSITGQVVNVLTLSKTGAEYILVPDVPDLSLTPMVVAIDQTFAGTQLKVKAITNKYNESLYDALSKQDINIIPTNTFALLQEAVKDPKSFNFTNTSFPACKSYAVMCTDESQFSEGLNGKNSLFSDVLHPSSSAHAMLAKYMLSLIQAPAEMTALSTAALDIGSGSNYLVNQHLSNTKLNKDATNTNVSAVISKKNNADDKTPQSPNFTVFLDVQDKGVLYGAFLRSGGNKGNLASGSFNIKNSGVGIYGKIKHKKLPLWLSAQMSYDRLSVKAKRVVDLDVNTRTHDSTGAGSLFSTAVQTGYNFNLRKVNLSPVVGFQIIRGNLSEISEDQSSLSTSMKFGSQSRQALIAQLGLQANYQANEKLNIFAEAMYNHNFAKDPTHAHATLQSSSYKKSYKVPVNQKSDKSLTNLTLGFTTKVKLVKLLSDFWLTGTLYDFL